MPTAQNAEIVAKLSRYRRPPDGNDSVPLDALLTHETDVVGPTGPRAAFAIAIDGSNHEYEEAFDRFPSTRVLYFQIAGVFCDLRHMLDQPGPFVSPARIADAVEQDVIPGFLPSSHLEHAVYNDQTEAFRAELFELFLGKQVNDRSLASILLRVQRQATPEDGSAANQDKIRVRRCPNLGCADADGERARDVLVPALASEDCPVCGATVWPTDVLRLHESFNPEGSNLEVLGRAMSAIEHLVIAGVALAILDDAPRLLPECAFITDGPLAQFGEAAPLRLGLLGVWRHIAHKLTESGLALPVVMGVEKTGYAVDHLRALRERIPEGTLMRLTDEYLKDRLRTSSWKETYYGRKYFYVSKVGQQVVITVPPFGADWSPYPSDAVVDRSDLAYYPTMRRTLALLDEIGTQLYDNALIPVALAHSFAAYPLTTSTQVLRLLTEQTLGDGA
ncbi:MAG: hypothetical protein M3364_09855 [Actinomycetota bacterium]|nr:hypothetical protein [Actinomycetota bacterium]